MTQQSSHSPWYAHIRAIADDPNLEARLTQLRPEGMRSLSALDPDEAVDDLSQHLKRQYVPSRQALGLARRILATACSHAWRAYPDVHTYIHRSTLAAVPVDPEPTTWLITGLAGIGKSALVTQLQAIFAAAPVYQASEHCAPKPILGGIFVTVKGRVSTAELFGILARQLGLQMPVSDRMRASTLQAIQNELYRQGCMFILVDESQGLANSNKGTGAIFVNFIATLRKFGVPVIVVGNYSMIHGMFKQHSQNRQRLLVNPFVMLPDDPTDPKYVEHLRAYRDACPQHLKFDPQSDAMDIHFLTGGGSRALLVLVTLAFQKSRNDKGEACVDMQALRRAYESRGYAVCRRELELLREHMLTGSNIEEDLLCPFELSGEAAEMQRRLEQDVRRHALARRITASGRVADAVDGAVNSADAKQSSAQHQTPPPAAAEPIKAAPTRVARPARGRRPPPSMDDAMRGWG